MDKKSIAASHRSHFELYIKGFISDISFMNEVISEFLSLLKKRLLSILKFFPILSGDEQYRKRYYSLNVSMVDMCGDIFYSTNPIKNIAAY